MHTAGSSGCMFILGRGEKASDFLEEKICRPEAMRNYPFVIASVAKQSRVDLRPLWIASLRSQ
ncbi:hypothetical protein [Novosphingobium sp.]|jgi:hypothetical protein|uniref:hypothetical protein n=1 Tax=Novosphingobium sp. TaxID=1874826 RepID=UPI002FE0F194